MIKLNDRLTRSQLEVLALIAEGLNNSDIARERICEVRTVERHITMMNRALNIDSEKCHTRVTAARMFIAEFGLGGLPEDHVFRAIDRTRY